MPLSPTSPNLARWLWVVTLVLGAALILAYIPRAFYIYAGLPPYQNGPGRVDVTRRWDEIRYVLRGRNPYDVAFANEPEFSKVAPKSQAEVLRGSGVFDDLGPPTGIVYPPWALTSGLVFFFAPKGMYIPIYGALMVAGLGVVGAWAWRVGREGGSLAAWALAAAALAPASWAGAIFIGNYPPVIVPLLIGALVLAERKWDVASGLLLGFAMIKPTVAAPFLLVFAMRGRWRVLGAAVAQLAVSTAATWWLTRTGPIEMLGQMSAASKLFFGVGFGPTQMLIASGVPASTATLLVSPIFAIVGAGIFYAVRRESLLASFAMASLICRLWTYHLYYDDAVMIFAVAYFGAELIRRMSAASAVAFGLLCVSLWMPGRLGERLPVEAFHTLVWVGSLAMIATRELARSRANASAHPRSQPAAVSANDIEPGAEPGNEPLAA